MFSGGVLVALVLGLLLFICNSCGAETQKNDSEESRPLNKMKDEEAGEEGWEEDWDQEQSRDGTDGSGVHAPSGAQGANRGSRGNSVGSEGDKGTFSIKGAPAMPLKPSSGKEGPGSKSSVGGSSRSRGASATSSPSGKDLDLFEAVGVQAVPKFDTKKVPAGKPVTKKIAVSKWDDDDYLDGLSD